MKPTIASFVVSLCTLMYSTNLYALDFHSKRASNQREFALLFVHGLSGSAEHSFGQWPSIVADDNSSVFEEYRIVRMSDFDIFVADYDTSEANLSLAEIGQSLANEIEAHKLFKEYDLVWVVAHSMGGIILHDALTTLQNRQREIYLRFLPAVLELGVPANGSKFAETAETLGSTVVDWLGYDPRLVRELRPRSGDYSANYLVSLDQRWADLHSRYQQVNGWPLIFCGYETKTEYKGWIERFFGKIFGPSSGIVVEPIYTSNVCTGAKTPVPVSHIQLPKPDTASADAHKLLRQMVRESLRSLRVVDRSRYQQAARLSLYDSLTALANATLRPTGTDSSSRRPIDRGTGILLYKDVITFSDPDRVTDKLSGTSIRGWSVRDAAIDVIHRHQDCLSMSQSENRLEISVKPACNQR